MTLAYQYGLRKTIIENLQDEIAGEEYETTLIYPQMAKRARATRGKTVAKIFTAVGKYEAKRIAPILEGSRAKQREVITE